MLARAVVATLAVLFVALVPFVSAAGATMKEPIEVTCTAQKGVTLEVKEARLDVDGELSFNSRVYHYEGKPVFPAPTIVMYPGEPCQITIVNSLSTQTTVATCKHAGNGFHCPDTTNLHTHGLHVSAKEDDVSTSILPGKQLVYTYHTHTSHLFGTHWFHAHHHGGTSLQVMGGMAGTIIMKPHADYKMPSDLAPFYSETGNSKLIHLNHLWFSGNDANSEAFTFQDYNGVSASFDPQTIAPNPTYTTGNRNFYTVNGQYQPVTTMPAGTATMFKFVHAVGVRVVGLELDTTARCTMKLIARDGVAQYTPYLSLTGIALIPGTRADVTVLCDAADAGKTVTFRASNTVIDESFGGLENVHIQANVFQVTLTQVGSTVNSHPTSQAPLPSYLNDLRSETVTTTSVPSIELAFGGGVASVNGVPFRGFTEPEATRYVDSQCLNKVYEYSIVPPGPPGGATGGGAGGGGSGPRGRRLLQTATGAHPYHQHVNHFQIVETDASFQTTSQVLRLGEWRDVAPVSAPNGFKLRVRPVDFTGDTVMHCHFLEHEDKGMMALYKIDACGDSSATNEADTTAPAETAPAVTGGSGTSGDGGGTTGGADKVAALPWTCVIALVGAVVAFLM